jgi:aspartate ammonia-lyase
VVLFNPLKFLTMVKYLKVSLSDAYHLIPIQSILGIEVGANTEVKILTHNVGHTATGVSEVLGYKITATTAADAAKTKEQLNSIVDAIEDALQTSWTNPYYLLEPKYAITAIAQIEEEWSA